MKKFLDENFLLHSQFASDLYRQHAATMPILDYHGHLSVQDIAEDRRFECLGEAWLAGDHYKWRAMRANGIEEEFCTGDASYRDKFLKWAETVPYTLRNPLYHWTHLELQRYFGVDRLLSPETAQSIYDECTEKLRSPEYSVRNLLRRMNVKLVCTTNDPVESLEYHRQIKAEGFEIKILPTFRPDRALAISDPSTWNNYLTRLGEVSWVRIESFAELVKALDKRHAYFHEAGCRLADHSVAYLFADIYQEEEIEKIFQKIKHGSTPTITEKLKFESAFLYEMARLNHKRGWAQQYHLGVFRNTNRRLFPRTGPDAGFDSIADYRQGSGLVRFLAWLDETDELARTVLYNLNPADNELFASMTGNFPGAGCPGKMQYGPAWWFLDQKDGIEKQLNALSNLGLLGRFIGMTTDSRSFLSFTRHEYFRRILCNLIGEDVVRGELPADEKLLGSLIENLCYHNAVEYFGL